ncbi:hypothetical protein E2C01_016560 [Portunus trituberculatus]|uniref:Uncharacterized protein n=1 Tax=Portunus trituberculatus TaxID=210409 RepID=A0A5B7DPR2_PORTR|nr:hypothetical protein [Portunus trituberculatus]
MLAMSSTTSLGIWPTHLNKHLLGQGDATWLVDVFLVVQHRVIPRNLQEVQDLSHPLLRVEHQLLIVHRQTPCATQLLTLSVHGLHGTVPPLQALLVTSITGDTFIYAQSKKEGLVM